MDHFLDDEGKLGHEFTSTDALEEGDLGDGYRPRPMFINAKLDPEYKHELVKFLKEYKDCFAWEYYESPDWIGLLLSIGYLLNLGIGHFSKVQGDVILKFYQI